MLPWSSWLSSEAELLGSDTMTILWSGESQKPENQGKLVLASCHQRAVLTHRWWIWLSPRLNIFFLCLEGQSVALVNFPWPWQNTGALFRLTISEVLAHGFWLCCFGHRAMQLMRVETQQRISVHLVIAGKRRESQEREEGARAPMSFQGHTSVT